MVTRNNVSVPRLLAEIVIITLNLLAFVVKIVNILSLTDPSLKKYQ